MIAHDEVGEVGQDREFRMSRASAGRRTLLKATAAASTAALLPWRSASAHDRQRRIATRLRFFGIDNVPAGTGQVRPDRLILSWCGVTSFALPR